MMEAGDGGQFTLDRRAADYLVNVFAESRLVHPYAGVIGSIFVARLVFVRETCHKGSCFDCKLLQHNGYVGFRWLPIGDNGLSVSDPDHLYNSLEELFRGGSRTP